MCQSVTFSFLGQSDRSLGTICILFNLAVEKIICFVYGQAAVSGKWLNFISPRISILFHTSFVDDRVNGLTHWGRVTHICISKLTIIDSDNGLSPGPCQAIIWTNAWILLIRTSGPNFSEISSEIHTFSFKKMHSKMSSAKWRPFCLDLNELKTTLNFIPQIFCEWQCQWPKTTHVIILYLVLSFTLISRRLVMLYDNYDSINVCGNRLSLVGMKLV